MDKDKKLAVLTKFMGELAFGGVPGTMGYDRDDLAEDLMNDADFARAMVVIQLERLMEQLDDASAMRPASAGEYGRSRPAMGGDYGRSRPE